MSYIGIWSVYHIQSLGDPKQDLAYERQYEQQTYQVIPEVIKNFIQYFHKTVSDLIDQKVYELQASRVSSDVIDQKVYEIQDIYENSWTKLTERFFKNTPWPEAETIAPQVGNGRCPGCWMGSYDWKSLESSEWSVSVLFFILFPQGLVHSVCNLLNESWINEKRTDFSYVVNAESEIFVLTDFFFPV